MKSSGPLPLFDFTNPPHDPLEFAQILIANLHSTPNLCMAAPDIGYPYRVFALAADIPYVCYNPRLVAELEPQQKLDELCVAYPGIVLKKSRAAKIRVRFVTPTGKVSTHTFSGVTAKYFLQGLDILNGVSFLAGESRLIRDRIKKRIQKMHRQ